MKNKSGIYMILNTWNNKCYIGSSKNLRKRKYEHFNCLRKNKHHSQHLQSSYNKYGENSFVFIILEECEVENLIEREIFWINLKNSLDPKCGYNIGIPQNNNSLKPRAETIKKILIAAYNKHYLDNSEITLEEFLKGKRKKDLIERLGPQNKKRILCFNSITGAKELEFESIAATAKHFKMSEKYLSGRIINKENRTCRKYILITEENFDSTKVYKKLNKPKNKYYKLKGKFKGNPLKCTNLKTGTSIIFSNKKDAINNLGLTSGGIDKVLYGKRKSHKSYTFELIR